MNIYSRGANPDQTLDVIAGRPMSLYAMAEELLARINTVAVQLGVDLPTRQVIYPSPIPIDCAQVSVLMSGWTPHQGWDGYVGCQRFKWAGLFSVVITRDTPAVPTKTGRLPGAALMTSAAEIASQDADVMVALVQTLEELGPEMTLTTGAPEGGFQSVELNIAVTAFGSFG